MIGQWGIGLLSSDEEINPFFSTHNLFDAENGRG
jgi:hypothetical protein